MEAKTKFQKSIVALSSKLPSITPKQKEWAQDHCFTHRGKITKKGITCLTCGNTWKNHDLQDSGVCPHCGRKLTLYQSRQRVFQYCTYFKIITTFRHHQIFRIFYIEVKFKYKQPPVYFCKEVVRQWIASNGQKATQSLVLCSNYYYCDQWAWHTPLELRKNTNTGNHIDTDKIYPAAKYLPEIKRNGFTGNYHEITPFELFSLILGNNAAETFLKTGEMEWLHFTVNNSKSVQNCWPAIKIALRHKENIKDKSLWIDYIELLRYFKKDIRNPKVIFPSDLHSEHDRYMKKKQKILELKQKLRNAKNEDGYRKSKSKYLDISFSNGIIRVFVLQSISDFKNEGTILHHCVYANEYYKKNNSLVLTARIGDERIETIEVSLIDYSIIQSRGKNNLSSKYHNQIIKLVNDNMDLIRHPHLQNQKEKHIKTHCA